MRYYRCKCGKAESWSSMGPTRCYRCNACGSDLAESPDEHRDPLPHRMVESKVKTDDGHGTLTTCIWCHKTKVALEAAGEPMEMWQPAAPIPGVEEGGKP